MFDTFRCLDELLGWLLKKYVYRLGLNKTPGEIWFDELLAVTQLEVVNEVTIKVWCQTNVYLSQRRAGPLGG